MRPSRRGFRALIACCLVLSALGGLPWAVPRPVAAGTAYTIVDLGTLRPDNSGRSGAASITESGRIAGSAVYGAELTWHAFLREPDGVKHDLGSLDPFNAGFSAAYVINTGGMVVGESSSEAETNHATVWQPLPGGFTGRDLGTLRADGLGGSSARGLNDAGIIVGSAGGHAARWQIAEDGTISSLDLGTLLEFDFGASSAQAINNAGIIVGESSSYHGVTPVRWEVSPAGTVIALDLGAASGGNGGVAYDINEAGQIVGMRTVRDGMDTQGTLWQVEGENQVTSTHLPALLEGARGVSVAQAINGHGLIVGESSLVPWPAHNYEDHHAVAWQIGPGNTASVIDLNSLIPSRSGWELLAAADVNDAGQIVGTGRLNGEDRAFLLNPIEGNTLALTTRNSATGRLDARAFGAVAVGPTPAPGPYAPGSVVTLTAQPKANAIFTGWVVDGEFRGWANAITLTITGDHTVQANFGPRTNFTDVRQDDPAREAIEHLAARGIVQGYGFWGCLPPPTYPCFGPDDPVRRAQAAVTLVRALGWQDEPQGDRPFNDLDNTDVEMQRAIRVLAAKGVVEGYGDGRFGPDDEVSRAQVISIIARALVEGGYWEPVTVDDPAIYPNIPADSPHRLDILTFVVWAGAVPYDPSDGDWPDWLLGGSRAWAAEALWRALDSTFGP